MKTNLLSLILLVAAGFVAQSVSAYDFSESYVGATFYYNILSEEDKTCEVTWKDGERDLVGNQSFNDYEGDVRKYVEGLSQSKIIKVLRSIPTQLAKVNKKFQFSQEGI